MSIWTGFGLAVQSLASNKIRASLTMLAIAVGVSAVILLVSVGYGARDSISREILGMGSDLVLILPGKVELDEGSSLSIGSMLSTLTYDDAKAIERQAASITGVTPVLQRNVAVKHGNRTRITLAIGVMASYSQVMNIAMDEGEFITDLQVDYSRRVCTLGKTVAEDLFPNTSPTGQRITLGGQRYTIIGVMKEKGQFMTTDNDDVVFLPVTSAIALTGIDRVNYIVAQAKDTNYIEETVSEIEDILGAEHGEGDFSVVTQGEMLGLFQNVMGTLTLMLGSIGGISLVVSGIGIMNIMLISVMERRREIGICKAVGAKSRDILFQFLVEAVGLSVIGGVIGLIVGVSASLLLKNTVPTQVSLWAVIIAFAVAVFVGVFFGIYPAWQASRQDPVSILRHE